MNRTFKYLLNNKKQNAGVIIIFTLIMVIQLLITSELWFKYFPSEKKALSQACYGFEVNTVDKNGIDCMMSKYPKDLVNPLDVQLVGIGEQNHPELIFEQAIDITNPNHLKQLQETDSSFSENVRIYAPITGISEKRMYDKGSYDPTKLCDDTVVLLAMRQGVSWKNRSEFDVGNYLYVLGNSLKIVGVADIFEVSWEEESLPFEYLSNIDTVLKIAPKHEIIFQFEKPLSKQEEANLTTYVSEQFAVTNAKAPYTLEQSQIDSLKKLTTIAILCITLCFWLTIEFIWYVLERRQKEFRVYQICGASEITITKLILIHISVLCLISECLGWGCFCLLQKHSRLIQLDTVPMAFALINIISFWIIVMIVVSVNLFLEAMQRKKLGLSRSAR